MANKSNGRIDLASFGGIALAIIGIVGGLLFEGGRLTDISSLTAGVIVLAGTMGAVMVTTPANLLVAAFKSILQVFWDATPSNSETIDQILTFARQARRGGLTSLEAGIADLTDPFLKKALSLAVDGADLQDIRRIMELEIELAEHHGEGRAKVFETAGGYAPTIGIIGAVLGLIQVMKHLEDIERVGHGIAIAFVATVYGVAFANLLLLPAGAKIRSRLEARLKNNELVLEGVLSIAEGMNPMLIESKLDPYKDHPGAVSSSWNERAGEPETRSAA
jgi:chemotaxis protein MotA